MHQRETELACTCDRFLACRSSSTTATCTASGSGFSTRGRLLRCAWRQRSRSSHSRYYYRDIAAVFFCFSICITYIFIPMSGIDQSNGCIALGGRGREGVLTCPMPQRLGHWNTSISVSTTIFFGKVVYTTGCGNVYSHVPVICRAGYERFHVLRTICESRAGPSRFIPRGAASHMAGGQFTS